MQAYRQHVKDLHAELCAKVHQADCERALAAFMAVLAAAGVEPWAAAQAQLKLESWDDCRFPHSGGLTDEEGAAALAWRGAVEAGRVELCDRAPHVSSEAFGLVDFLGRDRRDTFEEVFPLAPF